MAVGVGFGPISLASFLLFSVFLSLAVGVTSASSASSASSVSSVSSSYHGLSSSFSPIDFKIGVIAAMTASSTAIPWDRNNPNNPNVTIESGLGLQILNSFIFGVQEVNNNTKYSKWFKVSYEIYDDQWYPPRGFFGALDLIENAKARLIVGPTTSSTTMNAHVVSLKYNIPLLGYTASSPDLSNKVLYKNFFRVDQSDAYQANAMAWIVKNLYNWPRVATLATQDSYGSAGINAFSLEARRLGVNIVSAQTIPLQVTSDKLDGPLSALKSSRAKVFVYFGQDSEFRLVLNRLSDYGLDDINNVWFVSDINTDETVASFGNRTGFIGIRADPGFGSPLVESWLDRWMNKSSDKDVYYGYDRWAARTRDLIPYSFFAADSAYLIGEVLYDLLVLRPLGLNKTSPLPSDSVVAAAVQSKANFTQEDLFAALRAVSFKGISGNIQFDANQDRGDLRFQLMNAIQTAKPTTSDPYGSARFVACGTWSPEGYIPNGQKVVWRDGSTNVPLAAPVGEITGTGAIPKSANLSTSALAVLQAICALMVVFVLALMGMVWYARTSRVFHAASPKMMFVMLSGIAFVLGSALANNVNQSTGSCTSRLWLFNIGFSAAFGSLFLKTFRVWKIFSNERLMVKALNDVQLLQALAVIVSYDLILLILHTALSPYQVELYSNRCVFRSGDESAAQVLTILLTIGKALMVLMGAILTVKTKDLPSLYNETSYIAVLIYNVGVVGAIYLAIRYGLNLSETPQAITIIETIFILVCSCFACGVLFVPKVRVYFQQDYKMHTIRRAQAKRASVHGAGAAAQYGMSSRPSIAGSLPSKKSTSGPGQVGVQKNGSTVALNKGAEGKKSPEEIQAALSQFLTEQEGCLTAVLTDITNLNKKLAEQKERVNQLTTLIFSVQMEKEYFEQIGGDLNLEEINSIFAERMQRLSNSSAHISSGAASGMPTALRRPSAPVSGPAAPSAGTPPTHTAPAKAPLAKLEMAPVRRTSSASNTTAVAGANSSPRNANRVRAPSVSFAENTTVKGTGNHTPSSSQVTIALAPAGSNYQNTSAATPTNTTPPLATASINSKPVSAAASPNVTHAQAQPRPSDSVTVPQSPSMFDSGASTPSLTLGIQLSNGASSTHQSAPPSTHSHGTATASPAVFTSSIQPTPASPTTDSQITVRTYTSPRTGSSARSASPRTVRIHMA